MRPINMALSQGWLQLETFTKQKASTRFKIELVDNEEDAERQAILHQQHTVEQSIDMEITQKLEELYNDQSSIHQILFVSTPSSGTSTVLHQISQIYSHLPMDIPHFETVNQIRSQCYHNALALCTMTKSNRSFHRQLQSLSIHNDDDLPAIAEIITSLWNSRHIQQRYHFRTDHGMTDNLDYFFSDDTIHRIMASHYTPISDDIIHSQSPLRCQQTREQIHSVHISMDCLQTECIEIPSNLIPEFLPKKGYMLDTAKMIIFVVALSDYALTLNLGTIRSSKSPVNALKYSMECFERLLDSEWTVNMEIVVLFNKYDLFWQRIQRGIPMSVCFGPDDGWTRDMEYIHNRSGNANGHLFNVMTVGMIVDALCRSLNIWGIPEMIVDEICIFLVHQSEDGESTEDNEDPEVDRYVTNAMHFIREKFEALNTGKRQIIFEALDATKEQSVRRAMWNVENTLKQKVQSQDLDDND